MTMIENINAFVFSDIYRKKINALCTRKKQNLKINNLFYYLISKYIRQFPHAFKERAIILFIFSLFHLILFIFYVLTLNTIENSRKKQKSKQFISS